MVGERQLARRVVLVRAQTVRQRSEARHAIEIVVGPIEIVDRRRAVRVRETGETLKVGRLISVRAGGDLGRGGQRAVAGDRGESPQRVVTEIDAFVRHHVAARLVLLLEFLEARQAVVNVIVLQVLGRAERGLERALVTCSPRGIIDFLSDHKRRRSS